MRGSRPWTSEDDHRLRELAAAATVISEMEKQLNRSSAAIRTRATVLKIRLAKSGFIRGLKAKGK